MTRASTPMTQVQQQPVNRKKLWLMLGGLVLAVLLGVGIVWYFVYYRPAAAAAEVQITYEAGQLRVWAGNGVLSVDTTGNRVLGFAYHPTTPADKENYLIGIASTWPWQQLKLTPEQLTKYRSGSFDVSISAKELDNLKSLYAAYNEADAKKEPAAKKAMGAALKEAGDHVREQLLGRANEMRSLLSTEQLDQLKKLGPATDVRSVSVAAPPRSTPAVPDTPRRTPATPVTPSNPPVRPAPTPAATRVRPAPPTLPTTKPLSAADGQITYEPGQMKVWVGDGVLTVNTSADRAVGFAYHPTSTADKEDYFIGLASSWRWASLKLTPEQAAKYGSFDVSMTAQEFEDLKSLYAAYSRADAESRAAAEKALGAGIKAAADRLREQLQARTEQIRGLLSAEQLAELKKLAPTSDVRSVRVATSRPAVPPTQPVPVPVRTPTSTTKP